MENILLSSTHLLKEVLNNALFWDMGPNREAILQLPLNLSDLLLICFRCEALSTFNNKFEADRSLIVLHHSYPHFTHTLTPLTPLNYSPESEPDRAASRVETWNNLRASSTSLSRANGRKAIFARDSEILTMASSCRTVMGMLVRLLVSLSCCLALPRIIT